MNGISGYNSIMLNDLDYVALSKLEKLKHDLLCLKHAGYSGPMNPNLPNDITNTREWFIDDVKKQINVQLRKEKIQRLQCL